MPWWEETASHHGILSTLYSCIAFSAATISSSFSFVKSEKLLAALKGIFSSMLLINSSATAVPPLSSLGTT